MSRRNLMIRDDNYQKCLILANIENSNVSKIINIAIDEYIEKIKHTNFAFRLQLALDTAPTISQDEEEDIMKELSEMTDDDLKIVKTEIIEEY